jgi:hypothetical protein
MAIQVIRRHSTRCVHGASHFALRDWSTCWLIPNIDRTEVYLRICSPRSMSSKNCRNCLAYRDGARQAVSRGKGAILLLGNETAFQQAGTTQPEIRCQSWASIRRLAHSDGVCSGGRNQGRRIPGDDRSPQAWRDGATRCRSDATDVCRTSTGKLRLSFESTPACYIRIEDFRGAEQFCQTAPNR